MLVTVCASLLVPTFASTFDSNNTIVYRGHWYIGLSCKVGDIVMYNGDLYECVYANAVITPTDVHCWRLYDLSNFDSDIIYNEGFTDGFTDGYDAGVFEGAGNGYNKGYDDGYNDAYDEGYNNGYNFGEEVGLENGYNKGYGDGYDNGVTDTLNKKPTATLGHYSGATIDIYKGLGSISGTKPVGVEIIDATYNPTRIFDFLNLSLLNISDSENNDGWTINILFKDAVDFVENPFQIMLDCEKGYEFDLRKYVTVSFHSPSYDDYNLADVIYNDTDGVYIYIPTSYIDWSDLDMIQIKVKKELIPMLKNTSYSETPNLCVITNKPALSIVNVDVFRNYYRNGYNYGYNEGVSVGQNEKYNEGYNNGYSIGFNNGIESGNGFMGLFDGIASVPTTVLTSLFGFEIFGINIMATLCGLLGILVIVWVIKRFI